MGQQPSKGQLLYQLVSYGNVDGIKAFHREGVSLEYINSDGKTPLIAACLNPALYNVAKTLIELGANVNAYRPGSDGGTPLHHAAKQGLENMVKLLLSHGANALLMNDECQTPLDVARAKGCGNVVRIIESYICLYSGWLQQQYGLGFLEALAPKLFSRKVWVVVVPCGSRDLRKRFNLEVAIYASDKDAKPRTSIALWRASVEEPASNTPNPVVIISETSSETRIKLAPATESEKQQFQQFYSACKGIPQHPTFPFNTSIPILPATAPPAATEDIELATAINASRQSAIQEGIPLGHTQETTGTSSSATTVNSAFVNNQNEPPASTKVSCMEQPVEEAGPRGTSATTSAAMTSDDTQAPIPLPSAPFGTNEVLHDGPVHYPTIDFSAVDMSNPIVNDHSNEDGSKKRGSSSCVICLDAPVEGACVPCGHMAGCMSCLNEIKAKKWGCPVCRTKIDQVIRVYSV